MNPSTRLRPMTPEDQPFLYRLYASTRPDLTTLDLPAEVKDQLVETQFFAQSNHYHAEFTDAQFLVVMLQSKPIGRITVHHRPTEIHVVDLALLPDYRSAGIGTQLMLDVLKDGALAQKPVRVHVAKTNPAVSFYERLGFNTIAETEIHRLMESTPGEKSLID